MTLPSRPHPPERPRPGSAPGAGKGTAEAKELIGGFWPIQAKSKEEAIEWARRVPFDEGEKEIRQVFELEDFDAGDAIELHRQHRDKLAAKR